MNDDSLLYLTLAPAFVERALRGALEEMLAIRLACGSACDVREFSKLALHRSRRIGVPGEFPSDELACHEREAAVVRAAASFAASPVGRRLRSMPVERIVAAPAGIDAAVRDCHRQLHYVNLETYVGTEARLGAVTRAVRAMDRRTLERRASLHFFSLRDGKLRSYPATSVPSRKAVPRRIVAAA